MTDNIFAYTAPGCEYPGYVSINQNEAGDVVFTVRSAPTPVDGVRICGVTCHPGGPECNNYCNLAPEKGAMADRPQSHKFYREGATASFAVPVQACVEFIERPKSA